MPALSSSARNRAMHYHATRLEKMKMPKVRDILLSLAAAMLLGFTITGHAQAPKPAAKAAPNPAYAKAIFAGGCFCAWNTRTTCSTA